MPDPELSDSFWARLQQRVFETTGIHLNAILKIVAVLLVAIVGIGWILLSAGAKQDGKSSELVGLAPKELTAEEKFWDLSAMPSNFSQMKTVERLDILNSKIKYGEELANSQGSYVDQASELLLLLYGARCNLEETEGLDSEKSYRSLAQLRQAALATGDQKRVASADFHRAIAATIRLKRRTEIGDFRFASDAVISLESKNLVNFGEAQELYLAAINLHSNSSQKDKTAIYLYLLADKFIGSPATEVSDLGLSLKDYPTYLRFYEAVDSLPHSTRESRLEFYNELFSEIEKAPPQSPATYETIVELIDRLVNKSDLQTASLLAKRLGKATSVVNPKIKTNVDQSIESIETRIATLGKTIDLSGSTFDGTPLQLPNGKPTTLVFWQPSNVKSVDHLALLAESEWFDPWASNVVVACPSPLGERHLKRIGKELFQFKVLDNSTSSRLASDIGIDLIPYHVSLDKDNKVIRLGAGTD